jgi:hypothetical protein
MSKRSHENIGGYDLEDEEEDEDETEFEEVNADDEVEDEEEVEDEDENIIEEEINIYDDPYFRKKLEKKDLPLRNIPDEYYLNKGLKFMVLKPEYDANYSENERYLKEKQNQLFFYLFGCTEEGFDVLCKVSNTKPYLYVEVSFEIYENGLNEFEKALKKSIDDSSMKMIRGLDFIINIEKQRNTSIYEYSTAKKYFFKIVCGFPRYVGAIRRILENGIYLDGDEITKFLTYESNIPFHIRTLIDYKIKGTVWIEINNKDITKIKKYESTCAIEIEVDANDLIVHKVDKEWFKIAPLR